MMHDILDITSWAVKQGIADEDHLGIWGWSYGGYAAFAALAFWPDIYACGISMYGVSDVYDAVASRVERDGVDVWSEWLKRVGDIRTTKGQQLLRNQSPLNSVAQIHQPLLVTHGALDRIVEQRQSDTIVQRLRELNRPVTYFIYSNEGHDYRRPENWESFWAIAERFLHEHLGGRYEPYGDDIAQSSVKMITGAEHIPGLERTLRDVN
jgi:dipeptidyl aminopeptidase/acylaminoacyl peptidase